MVFLLVRRTSVLLLLLAGACHPKIELMFNDPVARAQLVEVIDVVNEHTKEIKELQNGGANHASDEQPDQEDHGGRD